MRGLTFPVLRGSVWSFGGQTAALLASLVATPFVIRLLGADAYGVFVLITVLVGYAGASDLGMGEASTRFGAERHALGDAEGEARVVWTALFLLVSPAMAVALAIVVAAGPIIDTLTILPPGLRQDAILALRIAGAGFVARAIASVANTPHLVRLRLDVVTLINATASVAQILLVPVVLWLGGGLPLAAAVGTACAAAAMVAHAVVARRFLPELARPRLASELVRPLLRYGGATTVVVLAAFVTFNGEKILLAGLLSATALAYYAVAFTLARLLALIPGAVAQAVFPAFSRLQGHADRLQLQSLYDRAIRLLVALGVPLAVVLCLLARPFLTVWAGPVFGQESALPLYILTVGCLIDGLSYVPRVLLSARNRPDFAARLNLIDVVPYLVLATMLTRRFGAAGAAATWSLRAISDCVVMLFLARRSAGMASLQFALLPFVPAVAIVVAPFALLVYLQPSLIVAVAVTAGSFVAYGCLVWTQVLTGEERARMDTLLRFRRFQLSDHV